MALTPLTGRNQLLESISEQFERGEHLLLRGPAGIGKTRLAAELVDSTATKKRHVERLFGSEATGRYRLGTLAALGRPSGVEAGDLPSLMSWYLGRWRSQRREDGPVVLWLDDVQIVDPFSANVIRQAVVLGTVQLVATHRTPEVIPDDLHALKTEGQLIGLDVPPLDRPSTAVLAESTIQRSLTDAQLDRLFELTAGNPLFVRDMALSLGDSTRPPSVRELSEVVGARFAHLLSVERRTAEMVAAAGAVDIDFLGDRRESVNTLIHLGLLRWQNESLIELEHPLYSAWLLDSLGPMVNELFVDLADRAASTRSTGSVDAVQELDWRLAASAVPSDELVEEATRLAIERSDAATAVRFTDGRPGVDLLRGQALLLNGDFEGGIDLLQRVHQGTESEDRVEAAFWLARLFGAAFGDHAAAHGFLDDVEHLAADDNQRRLILDARLWLWFFGAADANVRQQVVPLIDVEPSYLTFDMATKAAHLIYQREGPARSEDMAEMSRIGRSIGPTGALQQRANMVQAWYEIFSNRYENGIAMLESVFETDDLVADIAGMLGSTTSYAMAMGGRIRDAQRFARFGAEKTADADGLGFGRISKLVGAGADLLAGGPIPPFDALAAPTPVGAGTPDLEKALSTRILVLSRQRSGQTSPDDNICDAIAAHAENGKLAWISVFMTDLADRSMATTVHQVAIEAMSGLDGPGVHELATGAAQARIEGEHDQLVRVAARYESFGFTPAASRAFADVAMLEPVDSPLHSLAKRGAIRSLRHWDGGPTWWAANIAGLPTKRQLEIMWLVVDGERPPEIAARLHLSTRTVENHLYRVYRSLDVSGQEELIAAMSVPTPPLE